MIIPVTAFGESKFSMLEIEKQVEKIIADPVFADSDILKRFLSFIVKETLKGNSNQLKEYTIAINVLDKPADFNPHETGIVRIHASRLRRALNSYYSRSGILDTIRISVPRGSYVPTFDEYDDELASRIASSLKTTIVGVAPFRIVAKNDASISFADGLGLQLCKALMELDLYSVVAYSVMQNLLDNKTGMQQLATGKGVQLLISGEVQLIKGFLRVHIEFIRLRTGQLLWSSMFARKFSPDKAFDLQDEIVKLAMTDLNRLRF